MNVAANPSTPVEVLKKLAGDRNCDVRAIIARNPNTPTEILEILVKLSEDEYYDDVRDAVAGNPSTPVEVLKKLAEDEYGFIRYKAKENLKNQHGI